MPPMPRLHLPRARVILCGSAYLSVGYPGPLILSSHSLSPVGLRLRAPAVRLVRLGAPAARGGAPALSRRRRRSTSQSLAR